MFKNLKILMLLMLSALLSGCADDALGGDSNGGGDATAPITYSVTVKVTDDANGVAISDAKVVLAGKTEMTDALGAASFELAKDSYTFSITATGYKSHTQSFDLTTDNQQLLVAMTEAVPAPEVGYIFDSENEDSFYMQYWGDDWGSGAGITDKVTDANYSKVLQITSGDAWGFGAGIAWGNEVNNAIDISTYTHARFKIKSTGFTNVEVNVQSFTQVDSSVSYPISSGKALADGWVELEVRIPAFTDLQWFGLVFTSDVASTLLLADVSFVTQEVNLSQPDTAAPVPTVTDAEAFSIFSDSLTEDKFVSVWNANWWNAPIYSKGIIDSDNYARYEIVGNGAEGGVVGIEFGVEFGSVDVSEHSTWNLDLYVEPGITKILLQLVSTDGAAPYTIDNPVTGEWVSYEIPFLDMVPGADAALNSAQMTMAGIQLWGEAGTAVFVDNFYFSGDANLYELDVLVKNEQGTPITDAIVYVGAEGDHDQPYEVITNSTGVATLTLAEGKQKIRASADDYGIGVAVTDILSGGNNLTLDLAPINPGPTQAAEVPTVSNDDVIAIFSDTLSSDHYVTFWSDPWWNPPTHSFISLTGNNTSKFQITPEGVNGGVTGIQFGVTTPAVDASEMTGMRFDFYATSGITRVQFQVLSSTGPIILDVNGIETDGWISVEMSFDALGDEKFDRSQLSQMGLQLWGSTSDSAYIDNIYFY